MRFTYGFVAVIALAGCQQKHEEQPAAPAAAAEPAAPAAAPTPAPTGDAKAALPQAKAEVKALGTSGVAGSVTFTQLAEGGVRVEGTLHGLAAGEHGFHVHEVGNCDSPDGASAGPHFNPAAVAHGDVEAAASHVGDLGNITADAQGNATINVTKKTATLAAGPTSLIGRAVVVHSKQDDLKSQPAGDAGGRIGCGVITAG